MIISTPVLALISSKLYDGLLFVNVKTYHLKQAIMSTVCVWTPVCMDTSVYGHQCVWTPVRMDTSVYGHQRIFTVEHPSKFRKNTLRHSSYHIYVSCTY
jgi:hypothetical protein